MNYDALSKEGKTIFSKLKYFKDFYLAGGTGLALQLAHRQSVDFDLFSKKKINKKLLLEVKKVYSNKIVKPSVNNNDELTVFINKVKLTFLYYPYPVIYQPVIKEGVKILNIKEIAATKAYAIGRRGTFKDYIDLYFIIFFKEITLKEIIELAEKKYKYDFNARLFLEQLIYLKDIEDINIYFIKESVNKRDIESFFINKIKELKI